ncbi:WD40-repeat-containing domain protein [Kickxella alabastrina]|uniref:WD40-repeat-containing domain protein n=1 Tax=Kickxella alabastrina TaxID=61397 RepID=UPI00221EE1A3|nr:WD40-repeat-containing domain protein [Kickxella alabastrina]KAI7833669.1 WD40-repeat-containing domain protein [Kickxella alabastrina]
MSNAQSEQETIAYAKRKRQEERDHQPAANAQPTHTVFPDHQPRSDQETLDHTQEKDLTSDTLETRRRAMAEFDPRNIAVPTSDSAVRADLRKHGEPICLFGEDAADRRNRLRYVLSKITDRKEMQQQMDVDEDDDSAGDSEEDGEFYTEGSEELKAARMEVAVKSLDRARDRLERQRAQAAEDLAVVKQRRLALIQRLSTFALCGSQVGDARPVSRAIFAHDAHHLLTASWSGSIKLWDVPGCQVQRTYRRWHAGFASGCADGLVLLWDVERELPVGRLEGHQGRVVHVDHHADGRLLGSASYDGSWRLWDLETQKELLLQEGHAREVFALRFQPDTAALVATAGLDGIGRVWDLRSGRSIMVLEGHAREIYGLDWSPNAFQVATGAADNTVRIHDLRKMACVYQIPAHKSMVTDLRFSHSIAGAEGGHFLVSASNDGLVNVWSTGDWKLQKSLPGHVGKVLGVDVAPDSSCILWGPDDFL